MRAALLLSVALIACTEDPTPAGIEPGTMRERLATETHLFVSAVESAGVIRAQRRTDTGWAEQLVDLRLDSGQLAVTGAGSAGITVSALELGFENVAIPSTVVGHEAELRNVHLRLDAPTKVTPTWADDNNAQVAATLGLALSWSVTVDGTAIPLGAPTLPPLPITVQLTGDDTGIAAELRIHTAGELWSWAGLVKLSDLELVLRARTAAR